MAHDKDSLMMKILTLVMASLGEENQSDADKKLARYLQHCFHAFDVAAEQTDEQ